MSILAQLKSWRQRWNPKPAENDDELNRAFASAFSGLQGKQVLDYLIEKYYQPIEFVGSGDPIRLGERNGQQLMMVDILTRVDIGLHPMLYQDPVSVEDEKPMDGRE